MAAPEPDSLGASLLAWVRSFEDVGKVASLDTLSDGKALWSILQVIDGDYFAGNLPEPEIGVAADWTRKWQNLKALDKRLAMYYRDVCNGQNLAGVHAGPDLKAIAAEASVADLQRLIMEIIRAAMSSEETNKNMGRRLMGLGQEHAVAIAYEIRNMQEAEMVDSEPVSRDESAYQSEQEEPPLRANGGKNQHGMFGDPLMEREEELLQAQSTIEKLQASHAMAHRQLQELRQEKEHLQEQFDLYRSEIDGKGRKAISDDSFKKLQRQAESDRAYIDDLEGQLQSSKGASEKYQKQLQRYKEENEASQSLRDDLQMQRAENEDLIQKVKANENLKKKIQVLQEQEKTNASLRDDLKQANERLEDLPRLKQVQAALEKEIIEKKGLIRNQEYQINELTTTRKHAEYDARVLAQKLETARERQERDHEAMEELRAKLQELSAVADDVDPDPVDAREADGEAEKAAAAERTYAESKHFSEKLALFEQQLEAADARLKQASERNAVLDEQNRGLGASLADQQKAQQQQVTEHETALADLHRQVELAVAAAKLPREIPTQDLSTLQRENQLMMSAWYDLSGRLQNNGVSLGRRRQEPKSWIGKQRALVGPNSRLS